MNTKTKVILGCALVILLISGYIYYYFFIRIGDPLNISDSTLLESIKEYHELEKEVNEFIYQSDEHQQIGHSTDETIQEISNQLNIPENVIKVLGKATQTNDIDFFSKVFETNQFSQDLFAIETDDLDRTSVIEEMIKQMSRNGRLQDISLLNEKSIITKGEYELQVVFLYTDGKKARVTLHLTKTGGHSPKDSILYITDSVWGLIEEINKQTI